MVKRPLRVICLAIFAVLAAAWNGLRIAETLFFWKTLQEYGAPSLYIAISGGVWLVAGLMIGWGLWSGKAWGWAGTLGGLLAYTAWYWFDRLFLQKPHANWPFVLIADIVFLLITFIILFSRTTRLFFERDAYERKPKTPTITGS